MHFFGVFASFVRRGKKLISNAQYTLPMRLPIILQFVGYFENWHWCQANIAILIMQTCISTWCPLCCVKFRWPTNMRIGQIIWDTQYALIVEEQKGRDEDTAVVLQRDAQVTVCPRSLGLKYMVKWGRTSWPDIRNKYFYYDITRTNCP